MSLAVLYVWKASYLYQKVHTKLLFWPYAFLLSLLKLIKAFKIDNWCIVLQIVTYAITLGEKNGAHRRTKASFGRTMMQALELLWLAKGMSRDKAMSNSEEIKSVAIVIIVLSLSEGISQ